MAEHALRELGKVLPVAPHGDPDQRRQLREDTAHLLRKVNGSVLPSLGPNGVLVLQGTVPTQFRGATYHTPLRVEVDPRQYPAQPPRVRVVPTDTMAPQTAATLYEMDGSGNVRTPLIRAWDPRVSNVGALVGELQQLFGREPPLYALQQPRRAQSQQQQQQQQQQPGGARQQPRTMQRVGEASRGDPSRADPTVIRMLDDVLNGRIVPANNRGPTGGYSDIPRVKNDALETISRFPALRPTAKAAAEGTGLQQLVLDGTVPCVYRGSTYNIPVCVWFPFAYPARGPGVPECRVVPTQAMCVKPNHRHVDSSGQVHMSLLQQWTPGTSRVLLVVQRMVNIFEEEPPVYARPSGVPHAAGSGAAAARGGAGGGGGLPHIPSGGGAGGGRPHGGGGGGTAAAPGAALLQRLEKEGPPRVTVCDDQDRVCTVCMENAKNQVLLPCKHMCLCAACVRDLLRADGQQAKCPMCRKGIEDVIEVFA